MANDLATSNRGGTIWRVGLWLLIFPALLLLAYLLLGDSDFGQVDAMAFYLSPGVVLAGLIAIGCGLGAWRTSRRGLRSLPAGVAALGIGISLLTFAVQKARDAADRMT